MPTPAEPAEKTGKLSKFCKRHEMVIAWAEVVDRIRAKAMSEDDSLAYIESILEAAR